ncbi:MAG TPA: class D sortase [Candidatus Paceibacterota bacterium]|nr:class D sortase [Candidatus Paceibacterota bacterium]
MSKKRTRVVASFSAFLIVGGLTGMAVAGVQIYQSRVDVGSQVLPAFAPLVKDVTSVPTTSMSSAVSYRPYPKSGDVIGKITLPALKTTLPIIEGTGDKELKRGVGHFIGSVLPGEDDNSVLAGHRDSVFSQLGKLILGDLVVIRTQAGEFTYQVVRFRIVNADDRTVIVPTPAAMLTLSTCFPFRYIGNAPKRYIVSAKLIATQLPAPTV